MRAKPSVASSRPVCIDPISTRFLSVVKPRSSGARRLRIRRHGAHCSGPARYRALRRRLSRAARARSPAGRIARAPPHRHHAAREDRADSGERRTVRNVAEHDEADQRGPHELAVRERREHGDVAAMVGVNAQPLRGAPHDRHRNGGDDALCRRHRDLRQGDERHDRETEDARIDERRVDAVVHGELAGADHRDGPCDRRADRQQGLEAKDCRARPHHDDHAREAHDDDEPAHARRRARPGARRTAASRTAATRTRAPSLRPSAAPAGRG